MVSRGQVGAAVLPSQVQAARRFRHLAHEPSLESLVGSMGSTFVDPSIELTPQATAGADAATQAWR
jgi:hypothetical protein